jgi:hypothetical protein
MDRNAGIALWPLGALCAIVPFVASHVAFALSVDAGHVPTCLPYVEGCTSISRAARHGPGNHVFRLLMLPCAVLQALQWTAMRHWLRLRAPDPRAGASLPVLGLVAGIALAVYVAFLGTEGDVYRWMRSYGVKFYFAASYLALLVLLRHLRAAAPELRAPRRILLAIALVLLGLGLGSTAVSGLVHDEEVKFRLENLMEWNLGLLLSAAFATQSWLVHRTALRIHPESDRLQERP